MIKVNPSTSMRARSANNASKKKGSAATSFTEVCKNTGDHNAISTPISEVQGHQSIESLVSAQELSQNQPLEQRTVERGTSLLNKLEELRVSILTGKVDLSQLLCLRKEMELDHFPSQNHDLEKIRKLIEQRVSIEIIKLEK